jgi:hypothetical protein
MISRHTRHTEASPFRPGRSFVAVGVSACVAILAFGAGIARAQVEEIPGTELISAQYQVAPAAEDAAQAALIDAQVVAAAAAAANPASLLIPEAGPPPSTPPPPSPPPAADPPPPGIRDATISTPPDTSFSSIEQPAAETPAPPEGPAAPVPAQATVQGGATQASGAIDQAAQPAQAPTGAAQATQVAPSNVNVSVRIFSPGEDGPVTQTNTATGADPLASGAASPGGGTNNAPPAPPTPPASGGVAHGPPPPIQVGSTGGLPTTWIWNWQWTSNGCGSAQSPPKSAITKSTWTWTWAWGCAPPVSALSLPGVQLPTSKLVNSLLRSSVPGRTGARTAGSTPDRAGNAGRLERSARGNPVHRARTFDAAGVPVVAALVSRGSRTGTATKAAAKRPTRTVVRAPRRPLGDDFVPSGLTTAVAAAAGGGSAGSTGMALGMAALVALFVFFAPQVLLPLRTASVRRVRYPSSRLERPG